MGASGDIASPAFSRWNAWIDVSRGTGYARDPLNKSPRPSHPRNGRMTALPFAVNSAAIDSKCRLVLHPVPWRAGSRDLFRGSLES